MKKKNFAITSRRIRIFYTYKKRTNDVYILKNRDRKISESMFKVRHKVS